MTGLQILHPSISNALAERLITPECPIVATGENSIFIIVGSYCKASDTSPQRFKLHLPNFITRLWVYEFIHTHGIFICIEVLDQHAAGLHEMIVVV